MCRLDVRDHLAPSSRRQSFFDSTSCRMCLSRLRSATQLLQIAVLVLELLQPPQLAHAEPAIELLPAIERLLRDPHPTDHLGDRRPRLRLLQRVRNLLFAVPVLLHGSLLVQGVHDAGKLTFKMDEKIGGTSTR